MNWTIQGNNFVAGEDDAPGGIPSPDYGVVFGNSKCIILRGNTMDCGAIKECIVDLGNCTDMTVGDNPGQPVGNKDHWWPDL